MPQRSRSRSVTKGIERRGENQFRAKIRRQGVNEARTFETEAEARRWFQIKKGEIAGETHEDRTREKETTLREVLERYLANVTPTKRGRVAERNRILAWMRVPWAALPMMSISSEHITTWRNERVAAKKLRSTLRGSRHEVWLYRKISRDLAGAIALRDARCLAQRILCLGITRAQSARAQR